MIMVGISDMPRHYRQRSGCSDAEKKTCFRLDAKEPARVQSDVGGCLKALKVMTGNGVALWQRGGVGSFGEVVPDMPETRAGSTN